MSSSRYPPSVPPLALPGRSVISSNASSLQQSLQTSPEPARHSQSQVQSQTSTATQSQTSSLVGNPSQSDHVVTSKSTGLKPYNSPITQARPTQSKTQRATELADRGLVPYAAAPALQPQFTQASAAQQASPGIVPYQPYMPVQYMPPVAPMPMTPYFPMQPMYPSPYSYPVQPYSASPFQPPYPGQPVTPEVKVQQDFQKAIMCTAGLPIRGNKAPDNIPRLVEDQYGIRLVMPMKNMHLPSVEADKPLVDTRPPPELPARHATAVTQPG